MSEPVRVPLGVLEGLELVRESGETNMFDVWRVASLAVDFGYPEVTNWMLEEDNRRAYVLGLLHGFESSGEER